MTLKRIPKLILLSVFIFLGLLTLIILGVKPVKAIVPLPFGGAIALMTLCDEGILLKVGPPVPGVYMLTHVSVRLTPSIAIGAHPGQYILGLAETIPIPCTIDGETYSYGLPIIMAGGSSL